MIYFEPRRKPSYHVGLPFFLIFWKNLNTLTQVRKHRPITNVHNHTQSHFFEIFMSSACRNAKKIANETTHIHTKARKMLRDGHAPGCRFFSYFPRFSQIFPDFPSCRFFSLSLKGKSHRITFSFQKQPLHSSFPLPSLTGWAFFSISFYSHWLFVFSFCLFFFVFPFFALLSD